jgi:hypothetical protein
VGPTTLLVATQDPRGPFVVDMDARDPRLVRIAGFPSNVSLYSGALVRREGSMRWVVGASNSVYVIDGDPRVPSKMIVREAFVFPESAEPTLPREQRRVLAVAISPDGRTAAAGGDWRQAFLIDLEHPGATPRPLRPERGGMILSLAFAGGRLLVGNGAWQTSESGLFTFDLATGEKVSDERFAVAVGSIATDRDGRFALGMGGGAILVRTFDGKENATFYWPVAEMTHDDPTWITGLAFVEGGARLVAVTGAVPGTDAFKTRGSRLFTRSSRSADEPPLMLAAGLDAIVSLDVSEDGLFVATGAYGGLVEVRAMPD